MEEDQHVIFPMVICEWLIMSVTSSSQDDCGHLGMQTSYQGVN